MYTYIAGYLGYLAFELTVFHACAWCTRLLCHRAPVRNPYEAILVTLLGYLALPAICAHAITLLRLNSPAVWLGLVLTYWAARYAQHARGTSDASAHRNPADHNWFYPPVLIFIATVCVAALAFSRVLEELDSLSSIQDIVNWSRNSQDPNKSYFNYVSLWELRHVPLQVLAGECSSSWVLAVMPLFGIYIACLFITDVFCVPFCAGLFYALSSTLLSLFWTPGPTGIFTLKNDTAYNFAILAGTLALIQVYRHGATVLRAWWLALAVGLVCIKYSGILIATTWGITFLVGSIALRRSAPKRLVAIVALVLAVAMVLSGHHYVRNLVIHRNPFYPVALSLFGTSLPGTLHPEGTAILDGLGNVMTWRLLFLTTNWIHPIGPWLGPAVLTLLWWSPLLLCRIGKMIITRSSNEFETLLTGLLTVVYWYVYAKSFWSASAVPGDNVYLYNLGSIRYASAAVFLTEAFVLHVLWKATGSRWVLVMIASFALAYRICVLAVNIPRTTLPLFETAVYYGAPVFGLTAIAGWLLVRYGRRALPIAVLAYGAACLFITEKSVFVRCGWAELWSPIVDTCFEGSPKHVTQVVGGITDSHLFLDPLAAFYARGRRHQNDLHLVTVEDLKAHLMDRPDPDTIVCFASRDVIPDAIRRSLISHGVPADHNSVAHNDRAEAIGWLPSVSASDLGVHTGSQIPVVLDGHMPAPGRESTIGPKGNRAALWRENQIFAFGSPLKVYIIQGSLIRRLHFGAGDELSLDGYGDQAPPEPVTATIRWDGERWQISNPREVILDGNHSLLETTAVTAPDPMGYRASYDPVTDHATLVVTHAMPWVIWGFPLPPSAAGRTITVRARLHTNAGPRCNMHWFDYDRGEVRHFVQTDARESVDPQILSLVVDPIGSPERDYIGVGVARAAEGDTVRLDSIEFLRGAWDIPGIETPRY